MNYIIYLVPISFVIGLAVGFYLFIFQISPWELGTFTNTIPFASIFGMVGVIINVVI